MVIAKADDGRYGIGISCVWLVVLIHSPNVFRWFRLLLLGSGAGKCVHGNTLHWNGHDFLEVLISWLSAEPFQELSNGPYCSTLKGYRVHT